MVFFRYKKLIVLAGDIILLYIALFITLFIRYQDQTTPELVARHLTPFTLIFIVWIIVFFINNLYAVQYAQNHYKFYGYLIQNLAINALVGFTFFYLAPATLTSLKPLRVLIILLLVYTVLFLMWRRLFYALTSSKTLSNRLMLIGVNPEASELAEMLLQNPQLGYTLALIANLDGNAVSTSLSSVPRVKELTDLSNNIKKYNIQTIVTVNSPHSSPEISQYLFDTLKLGIKYYNFPTFYENITGKVPVASLEKHWFLENLLEGNKRVFEIGKRFMDITVALLCSIASIPLLPLIYLAVKTSSPGPVVFKQTRIGRGGRPFTAMKFRTMVANAEASGPQWARPNDSRVTAVGRFLRKTRLDEIPQFVNILRGDMSFVGPRPERPEFVQMLSAAIPFYNERLLVKPGLTGWAQINFRYGDSVEDTITKLQYDLFYIKNRSFTLDISIILKTIHTVFDASMGQ